MKRKNFIKNISLVTLGAAVFSNNKARDFGKSDCKKYVSNWLKAEHCGDKYYTKIKSPSIKKTMKVFHLTDSHLSITENSKLEYSNFTKRMDNAYQMPEDFLTGVRKSKTEHFETILKKAGEEKVDLVLLTGDILNYPSEAGVKYITELLEKSGLEYLYIAGNHDWHYEGMKGSLESLRNKWINQRLLPLYKNENPFYYSKVINGINFVMIDDSTYQISKEQLEFFREEARKKYPIVLSLHIPVYQPEDRLNYELYTIADPRWGYEYDKENYLIERRERWSKEGNTKETLEFVLEIVSCKKLLALLAGHDHSAITRKISPSANMYLTQAAFSGAYRIIEFLNC